jgi:hypothetical protein
LLSSSPAIACWFTTSDATMYADWVDHAAGCDGLDCIHTVRD